MSNYNIYDSKTGSFIRNIWVEGKEAEQVEWVSGDNSEGHFAANRLGALADLGDVSVFAVEL